MRGLARCGTEWGWLRALDYLQREWSPQLFLRIKIVIAVIFPEVWLLSRERLRYDYRMNVTSAGIKG